MREKKIHHRWEKTTEQMKEWNRNKKIQYWLLGSHQKIEYSAEKGKICSINLETNGNDHVLCLFSMQRKL